MLKKWTKLLLVLSLTVLLAACSGSDKTETQETLAAGEYYIYYTNQTGTKLVREVYMPTGKDTTTLVRELLGALKTASSDVEHRLAVPESIYVNEYKIENKILYLMFDGTYRSMDRYEEVLCRAALVKTLTQIEGVDYVSISVNSQPLLDANGKPIGIMQEDSFVEDVNGNLNSLKPITLILYYTNESGDTLYETERTVLYNSNLSVEKLVLNQLIQGPGSEDLYPTLPDTTTVLGVSVKEGICYVNFDSNFLSDALDVSDYIPIYSVVNSLSEISGINKVQITINGSSDGMFRDKIPFSTIFERNLDYVGGVVH